MARPLRLIKGSPEIAAHFGEAECRQGTSPPLARMSYLYEVRSNLIVAAEISPYVQGELTQRAGTSGGTCLGERLV